MPPFEPQSSSAAPRPAGPDTAIAQAVVLAIGGSDSSGGAGIQADLRTVAAHGLHAATTLTAITAQGPRGFRGWLAVPVAMVRAQLDAALTDWPIRAVKTGMLANADIVHAVADALSENALYTNLPLVLDPVFGSSSGAELLDADGRQALLERLFPRAAVITPNLPEAASLSGLALSAPAAEHAAIIARLAPRAVIVVKGGHAADGSIARDTARFPDGRIAHLDAPRIATDATQGTGCTFASAIAAQLARAMLAKDPARATVGPSDIMDALVSAKAYLTGALAHAVPIAPRHNGKSGPLAHFWTTLAPVEDAPPGPSRA